MKRDINNLLNDRTAQEHDARLRRTLKADDVAASRQIQAAEVSKAQVTKFRKALDKWNANNISPATNFVISEPRELPVGTVHTPDRLLRFCTSSACPLTSALAKSIGAQVNRRCINRDPTRFEVFNAFLPPHLIQYLANATTSRVAVMRPAEQLQTRRQYRAVTPDEVLAWISQRLQFSVDIKVTIDSAYKSV